MQNSYNNCEESHTHIHTHGCGEESIGKPTGRNVVIAHTHMYRVERKVGHTGHMILRLPDQGSGSSGSQLTSLWTVGSVSPDCVLDLYMLLSHYISFSNGTFEAKTMMSTCSAGQHQSCYVAQLIYIVSTDSPPSILSALHCQHPCYNSLAWLVSDSVIRVPSTDMTCKAVRNVWVNIFHLADMFDTLWNSSSPHAATNTYS